ncbi:Fc.00g081320.m01.CDS01 [Cosmosporella sp. VM-42]
MKRLQIKRASSLLLLKSGMPTQSCEDARERRRRQNRESQQRWRQRHKRPDQETSITSANRPFINGQSLDESFISPPPSSNHSESPLGSRALNSYFVQEATWFQDQPAVQDDFQNPWPTSLKFPIQEDEGSLTVRPGQSDGAPHQSISGHWNGCHEFSIPRTDGTVQLAVPQVRGHTSSRQLLSTPDIGNPNNEHLHHPRHQQAERLIAASDRPCDPEMPQYRSSTRRQPELRSTETSSAEKTIQEVQVLYNLGVRAGFLRKNETVRRYLNTMERKYQKIHFLGDEDCEESSSYDPDEWYSA